MTSTSRPVPVGHQPELAGLTLVLTGGSSGIGLETAALARFFKDLPAPIDYVMITASAPDYEPLLEMDSARWISRSATTRC